jgi:carbon monoxide dehydrogenase subunit G
MRIESKKVQVPATPEIVFQFVTDLNNFVKLLPAERISEWESNENYCSFKVQGTATIDLSLKEKTSPENMLLESGSRSPFPFTLNVSLRANDGGTEAGLVMDADINPFLKMMVEKPLSNLFNYIAEKLVNEVKS